MDIQKLTLLGRATRDAELIEPKAGNQFAVFTIAVNRPLPHKESKEKGKKEAAEQEEATTFYDLVCFGVDRAKIVENRIKKGDLVWAEGRPEVAAYLSKDGEPRANLKLVVDSWQSLRHKK
ncbi:MAG: single-stranded DNA-binding protein [Candidatus Doudnabacteria bacterium]|nr:single-stranded DNA-binding protein [Candidatus Doudnabacteria bacterium]